jgi:alpha-beta hydrolase superfamily lysophospholipase
MWVQTAFIQLWRRFRQTNVGLMHAFLAVGLMASLASSRALAEYDSNLSPAQQTCKDQYVARAQKRFAVGVPFKHLPRLFVPTENTKDTIVIFTHGIFESPYFFKGVGQSFADEGYITMSILLPGHWQSDWSSIRSVTYRDWMRELNENIKIARCFGKKIIFAGHSLGGLLSMQAAVQNPDVTAGLMLWSPALKVRTLPAIGSAIGGFLHIDGNILMGKANLDETPLYSPNAAAQIEGLIDYVRITHGKGTMRRFYHNITTPTFLAYAERDPAVDVDELNRAAYAIAGLKDVMYFPKETGVYHGNITKYPGDSYERKSEDYNRKWKVMNNHIVKFLRENI